MLKIKQKFHFSLPHFDQSAAQPMTFSPVQDDSDELTQAIVDDPIEHDNEWDLEEHPYAGRLEAYWDEVEDDIRHDPQWITFSEDEA